MTPTDGIKTGDIAVDILIAVSQWLIAYYLFADAKPRLSKQAFRTVFAVFVALGLTTLCGMLLNLLRSSQDPNDMAPRLLNVLVVGVEMIWGFTGFICVAIYTAGRALVKRLPEGHSPVRRQMIQAATGVAMASPIAALAFGAIVERTSFQVKEIDLPVPGLPPEFEGFTIAQVSDLHVSPYLSIRQAARVIDMTNELKPRLTLMTGDLITSPGDPLDETIAELARLRSDTGVLGCLGNHEHFANCERYTQVQARRRGIEFLRMQSRQIRWGNAAISFAGVDYQPFRDKKNYLRGAEKLIVPGMPNILLSHNPDVFPAAVAKGYGSVIGGHTHAGQVTVEILRRELNVVRFATPFVAGLYREGAASCYVTAGIGTIGMPVRLGAPPEITLLRLRRA